MRTDRDSKASVPELLRLAADAIERGDRYLKVVVDDIDPRKVFLGILMRQPSDD